MRKTRVKRLKAILPKRLFRGQLVALTRSDIRKAKRVYTAWRAHREHGTQSRRRRVVDIDAYYRTTRARRAAERRLKARREAA